MGLILKVCLPLLAVSTVMIVVTLAETYWFSVDLEGYGKSHAGLWKSCVAELGCADYDGNIDWIKGPQALVCLSLVCAVGALALAVLTMVRKNQAVGISSAVLSMLSGILGIVGAAVFRNKVDAGLDPDWCFFINVVVDVVMVLVAIVLGIFIFRAGRAGGYENI